ncbi:MAG: glycoside hydrolase [Pseudomonadota bacterium]
MSNIAIIDFNKSHQTIEGLGTFAGRALPFFTADKREDVAKKLFLKDGLELSIIRIEVSPYLSSFTPLPKHLSLEDPYFDPNNWSKDKLTENERKWRAQIWIVLKAKSLNPDIKVLASTWSPPLNMKIYDTEAGKAKKWYQLNRLKPECYTDFSDYLVGEFLIPCKEAGIPIDILSPQNEPEFPTPDWGGCVWFPWETTKFIEKLSAGLKNKDLATKIMAGETANSVVAALYVAVMRWFKGSRHIDILATHGYSFPRKGMVTYNTLQLPWPLGSKGKRRYVTEISSTRSYDSSIKNALQFAVSMHKFLSQGDVNALIFWLGMIDSLSNEALIGLDENKDLAFPKVFDVFGQFTRYISVGAVRVDVSKKFFASVVNFFYKLFFGQKVYISAYRHPKLLEQVTGELLFKDDSQALTIVLINTGNHPETVPIELKDIVLTASWQSALTDATHRWTSESEEVKLKDGNQGLLTVEVPANSVLTLRNEGVVKKNPCPGAPSGFFSFFKFFYPPKMPEGSEKNSLMLGL